MISGRINVTFQEPNHVVYPIAVTIYGEALIPKPNTTPEDILEIDGVKVIDLDSTVKAISKSYHPTMEHNRTGERLDLKA
ncbi:MAG TPA: hypothetical protein VI815_01380 [Candidatus Nanoarchaeia archaeon]|nr:hypothetical protein [Candidatus Nanoarchaeia archaeon]